MKSGLFSMGAATFRSLNPTDEQEDEKLVFREVKAVRKIDEGQYESLWNSMAGITDHELDWKIQPEVRTVGWIIDQSGPMIFFSITVIDHRNPNKSPRVLTPGRKKRKMELHL